jgi:hypothetical protein
MRSSSSAAYDAFVTRDERESGEIMLSSVAAKVAWVGRSASLVFGLALVMALVVGSGSIALAAVPGDPFKLGRLNTVDQITRLLGSASDAMLRIDNDGSGTALDSRVEPGEAPITVDSDKKVASLNDDELDGKTADDFISEDKTYKASESEIGPGAGTDVQVLADCDSGDRVLGGGALLDTDIILRGSEPTFEGWKVVAQDNGSPSFVSAKAICADFPPLRP